jgi:hypothetical protein
MIMAKPTFLTLPLEIRFLIYRLLKPSDPLSVRSPEPQRFSHKGNKHPRAKLALLSVCWQIRSEAAPVFFNSVYLGAASKLADPSFETISMSPFYQSCVREATFDLERLSSPLALREWLHCSNPFPQLQACEMVAERCFRCYGAQSLLKTRTFSSMLRQFQRDMFGTAGPPLLLKATFAIFLVFTEYGDTHDERGVPIQCVYGVEVRQQLLVL